MIARIGRAPDRAILGCTHYEIIAGLFQEDLFAVGFEARIIGERLERHIYGDVHLGLYSVDRR